MTDFDQTDPWGQKSPWDEAQPQQTAPEVPVTNQPNAVANPDNVTLSFKGGTGHDASLLVLRAGSLAELDQMLDQQASYLKSVVEKASRVQAFSTNLNAAAKTSTTPAAAPPAAQPYFNQSTGQVQHNQASQPPFGGGASAAPGPNRPPNVPEGWTYKEGTNKNNKPYKGWFPPRGVEAAPIWV